MITDILYLACNRLEFTQFTWQKLIENTDWDLVHNFYVFDDGSTDGTREFLQEAVLEHDHKLTHLRFTEHGGPVGVMLEYLSGATCDAFAKIDNDIVVPPNWLETMQEVLDPSECMLLGMEGGRMGVPGENQKHDIEEASHIGGVGLMRRFAFQHNPPMQPKGRFGFTEWQRIYRPPRGWIRPDILVSCLDMVPVRWCMDLSEYYVHEGWQREWGLMHSVYTRPYWDWWAKEEDIVDSDWQ